MSDLETLRALIAANAERSKERHKAFVTRHDELIEMFKLEGLATRARVEALEDERMERSRRIEAILSGGVAAAQEREGLKNRLDAHELAHYGSDDGDRLPRADTASTKTLAKAYPGRVAAGILGTMSLTVYEVRVWVYEHAAWVWKAWWKIQ